MTLDIDQIRKETPGVKNGVHLLAAGSALMPRRVVDAVIDHTRLEVEIGGYEAHEARFDALEAVYGDVATLINCAAHEVALVDNATVAWCAAFYALRFKPGDIILTAQAEYASNYLAFLQRARRDGVVIRMIPSDETGAVDVEALEAMINDRVALIAITWAPTNGGLVNPAAEVGEVAARHAIPYLLDACQAVGQMPVDVKALKCDFLSATGRKFLRGPRGTGFLHVAEKWLEGPKQLEPAMIDLYSATWTARDEYILRDDARRFENWENSYALRAGLGQAIRLACDLGLDAIRERAWGLADYLRGQLDHLPGAQVLDAGTEHSAIVSFAVEGIDPVRACTDLQAQNITVGSSTASSTLLDAQARSLPNMLRAAPHYYNTRAEIDRLVGALNGLDPR